MKRFKEIELFGKKVKQFFSLKKELGISNISIIRENLCENCQTPLTLIESVNEKFGEALICENCLEVY